MPFAAGAKVLLMAPLAAKGITCPTAGRFTPTCGTPRRERAWRVACRQTAGQNFRPERVAPTQMPFQAEQVEARFLPAWFSCVAADWLQGPYLYALYAERGLSSIVIAKLFAIGFVSSAALGSVAGRLCDRIGTRCGCQLYCACAGLSCLLMHSAALPILAFSRVLGGISDSLLYTAFEAWAIEEHKRQPFPTDASLRQLLSHREAVCVGVRLRPFVAYESGQEQCLTIEDNTVHVDPMVAEQSQKAKVLEFAFDCAMDSTDPNARSYVSQDKCYQMMAKRMVDHVLGGYFSCLFCYGQTGTGKTTTIMGKVEPVSEQGLLLRLMNDLFAESPACRAHLRILLVQMADLQSQGSEVHCKVQMLEVYNEKVRDLLVPMSGKDGGKDGKSRQHPEVHVHPKLGVYVKGVADEPVESFENCVQLIEYGNTMKTVAATAMNAKSSRAHTIFKLMVEKRGGTDNTIVTSEAFFVDLAGRENEKTTKAAWLAKVSGERLVELTFINQSLMWLASCIQALAKPDTRKSMSAAAASGTAMMSRFRNSKLTLLLSNALSGNSKTSMIGTLSPALANFEESYSTLTFASTVKNIKIKAKPASAVDKDALVKTLQEELHSLKEQLAEAQEKVHHDTLTDKLEATEELVKRYRKGWNEASSEAKRMMSQRGAALEKLGAPRWSWAMHNVLLANKVQQRQVPHLANYSEDPHMRGRLMFHPAQPDREYSLGFNHECDFLVPHGLGIQQVTCFIHKDSNGRLSSSSSDEEWHPSKRVDGAISSIEVNGIQLKSLQDVELQHLDCVVLGRSVMLYAFTEPGSDINSLPADKAESLILEILGSDRAEQPGQLQMALKYMSELKSHNLDSDGATSVQEFMLMAQKAATMVEEANQITAEVRPGGQTNLRFELCTIAPILALGYGRSLCPELSVRLVRQMSPSQAKAKASAVSARRASLHSSEILLEQFSSGAGGVGMDEVEVLYNWTFEKFCSRLQIMQEVWQAHSEDPENFDLDEFNHPWSEQGPSELAELRQRYDSLRESIISASPKHMIDPGAPITFGPQGIRKQNDRLEEENQRLRQQVSELSSALMLHSQLGGVPQQTSNAVRMNQASFPADHTPDSIKGILDLSKTNLLLVLDLFDTLSRLSSSMLNASAACLKTTPDGSTAVDEARKRLAEASSDLANFFAETSPNLGPVGVDSLKDVLSMSSSPKTQQSSGGLQCGFLSKRPGKLSMWSGSWLIAVLSGIVGNAVVSALPTAHGDFRLEAWKLKTSLAWGGPAAAFDLAAGFCVMGAILISVLWQPRSRDPAAGEGRPWADLRPSARPQRSRLFQRLQTAVREAAGCWAEGLRQVRAAVMADPWVIRCGAVTAAFEGALFVFVFSWTPVVLNGTPNLAPHLGLVFSLFMASCACGSWCFNALSAAWSPERLLQPLLTIAALALLAAAYAAKTQSVLLALAAFALFELCVGIYFPCISTVKSHVVPDSVRTLVYSLYRVPQNAFALAVLLRVPSQSTALVVCAVALLLVEAWAACRRASHTAGC
ncbi:unc-104 [Symbiodinium sp. CCMP2456]|nr:unc-104 [Symbiodinium sp. CCMP2456]